MMIEPCCIQNQLPALMRGQAQGCFYSNGDWGAQKLMWATAWLVEGTATTILLMPAVDVFFCRYLRQCLQRDWTKAIVLCTKEDCTELVVNELANYQSRVFYTHRKNLCVQGYYRYSSYGRMAICGPLDEPRQFCQYHFINGSRVRFAEMIEGIVPLFTTKIKEKPLSAWCQEIRDFLERRF